MKNKILGLVAFVLMVSVSFAQPGRKNQNNGRHPGMEFKKLNLTADQEKQIESLNHDFQKQLQDLNKIENITVKEQRDRRVAIGKEHKLKMESMLTPEQKNQMAQMRVERKNRMEKMAGNRMEKLKEKLNLSEDQYTALKSTYEKSNKNREAILQDDKIDRAEKRQQLTTIQDELKNNIEKVLTPEQKSKMESMQNERHEKMRSFRDKKMENSNVK